MFEACSLLIVPAVKGQVMFDRGQLTKKGSIQVLERPAREAKKTLVMFHGYGADAYDLSSLANEVEVKGLSWVFPQGPLKVPIGPEWTGRAWFSINIAAIGITDHSKESVRRMDSVRPALLEMLNTIGVASENLILGGFSQGSMVAMDLALNLPKPPKGLVILSGALFDEEFVRSRGPALSGIRYFQSHGMHDDILPFAGAQRLNAVLDELQWDGHLIEFAGGHEIPLPVIKELKSFLQSLI